MRTLGPSREPGYALVFPYRGKVFVPAGQKFMRIRLVADVPYYLINRGIKDIMERNRQFYHSEVGSQMSAINRYPFNNQGAEFLRKGKQFFLIQRFQIKRRFYVFYKHSFHSQF